MDTRIDPGDDLSKIAPINLGRERSVRLGALTVEPALRRIAHPDGREEIVEPRVMQVLVALLAAEGRILTRDDLQARCWSGVVVGEDAITRVIGRLRRLGEGLGAGHFKLDTITKVGYRLIPVGAAGGHLVPTPEPAVRRPSVCVLPFADLSVDEDQAYFSDGMSEDIITDLAELPGLTVVSRAISFSMKGAPLDRETLRTLNVTHLLEGSIRKAGDRLRISARLEALGSGEQVWAQRWDRDLGDVFALQDEISHAVVRALRLTLFGPVADATERRGTRSADAYNLYLQARALYVGGNQGSRTRDDAIIALCRCAIEIDPDYARAWALMAIGWAWLISTWGAPPEEGWSAVTRALELDPNLPEAHAVRAKLLHQSGSSDQAFEAIDHALRLDPESYEAHETGGLLHYGHTRLTEAARHYEKAATLMESDFGSAGMLMTCHKALGDADRLVRSARLTRVRAEAALERDPNNGGALGFLVAALSLLEEAEQARDWMTRGLQLDPNNPNMRYNFACALVNLQDFEAALDMLEPVFATMNAGFLGDAKVDADLHPLRSDVRLQSMMSTAEARLAAALNTPAA